MQLFGYGGWSYLAFTHWIFMDSSFICKCELIGKLRLGCGDYRHAITGWGTVIFKTWQPVKGRCHRCLCLPKCLTIFYPVSTIFSTRFKTNLKMRVEFDLSSANYFNLDCCIIFVKSYITYFFSDWKQCGKWIKCAQQNFFILLLVLLKTFLPYGG